jgi:hydrogenase maturation factor
MNLIYGEVIEVFSDNAMRMGKVKLGGAMKKICLDLLADIDVRSGDTILVCDGVALSKVDDGSEVEENDVSGNTR